VSSCENLYVYMYMLLCRCCFIPMHYNTNANRAALLYGYDYVDYLFSGGSGSSRYLLDIDLEAPLLVRDSGFRPLSFFLI
jgi:hypothetical protein